MKRAVDILLRFNGRMGILADQMVLSGGNFVLVVLLARWLGIEAFGHFALAWMAVLFALSLHQAFITQPMFTFYGKTSPRRRQAWLAVLACGHLPIALILALVGTFLLLAARAEVLPESWHYIGLVVATYTPLHLLQEFLRKASFAEGRALRPLAADVLSLLLLLGGLAWLQWQGSLQLETVLLWWSAALSAGLAVMAPRLIALQGSLWHHDRRWRSMLARSVWARHYHFSKWLLGKALLQWFSGNAFIIAGASVLGPAAAGAVRIAQNVLGLTHVLFLSLESIIPVQAARQLFDHGYSAFAKYMHTQSLRYGLITALLLALIALSAEPLTTLLYGAEAAKWAWVIQAYCLLYLFVYASTMAQFAIRTLEQTQSIFWGYAASAAFGLVAVVPMVHGLKMTGLLAGLIISQCMLLAIYLWALRRQHLDRQKKAAPHSASPVQ